VADTGFEPEFETEQQSCNKLWILWTC